MRRVVLGILFSAVVAVLASCTGSSSSAGPVALTYTYVTGDPTPEILEALSPIEQLEGIEVRALTVPSEVIPEVLLREPYVLSLSTGSSAIDVYLLDAPWVKSYSATGWLAPISGGRKEDDGQEIDLSPFRSELLEVTSIRDEKGDRVVLALPFQTKGNILFYRKDLLEDAGFEPPQTWAELFSQCESILAEKGEGGEAWDERLRYGFLFHGKLFINDFYPIMWGFGGGIFDENEELAVDSAENVRALAMIGKMLGGISPPSSEMQRLGLFDDYSAPDRLFASGAAIFMVNWNTRLRDLESGLPGQTIAVDQVGVAPIPGEEAGQSYSNIGSFCWGINYYSHHRDAARRFIEVITSYEAQRWAALNRGELPSRWDVLRDPEVQRRAPSMLEIAKVFEKVRLRARPFQREINDILDFALIETIKGGFDPLQALEYARREIERELSLRR
ncbi:MAG TPA: extracellular solute-binding protein [Acidobacteriota bacterium]|nr:extracellular solute-binding protein [Acidobacteriota bacterium]